MLISRKSQLTGITHEKELPVTKEQLLRFTYGERVQVVFPELSAEDREFILSGITAEEWDAAFKDTD